MRVGSLELCGHGQGPNIIQYHFMSLPGQGKGPLSLSFGKKENSFLVMGKAWWLEGLPAIVFTVPGLVGILRVNHPFFVHLSLLVLLLFIFLSHGLFQ